MLLFLVTSISFLFFMKSICPKSCSPWAGDICFSLEHMIVISSKETEKIQASVLDLPDHVLDCILERLPPADLRSLASVCGSFRERCSRDHLWERHLKLKWGRVLGPAAYAEWQRFTFMAAGRNFGLVQLLWLVWPFSQLDPTKSNSMQTSQLPIDSAMSWYLALETGKFGLPAQVYNRQKNVHGGFMLSCYDAQLTYDLQTDTFQARYPSHGRKAVAIETGIEWERVRAPPLDKSDCLNDLRPGDHIEIQWRKNKDLPYGWWYCVVGHLESCDRNEKHCLCHSSDGVMLEFKQYSPGSRWRCATINRKEHIEERNEADGFYGGIRKLHSHDEIATWKSFWPRDILE